jgi:serine/threonine protein phosphatase PrpC
VNLLLQPLPPNYDSETQLAPLEPDYKTLIRLNLWAVIDGHGGGSVATYTSEVLLPHIAASVSRALNCAIVDRGVCIVNGELRDANALDLDGLIKTTDRCHGSNPNSIHYRSPYERSDSDDDDEDDDEEDGLGDETDVGTTVPHTARERKQIASLVAADGGALVDEGSTRRRSKKKRTQPDNEVDLDATVPSVKTSVKTAVSLVNREELVGTHHPGEVASITRAITESFLAVDEGWINSIDPVATQQTSCQSNGRWNSGACALVVFTIQRLDWTNVAEPEREKETSGLEENRLNTSQNRDAARRRMLDYARRSKCASSVSTASSTSSLTTEEVNASGIESEITETEGEDDDRFLAADVRKRAPSNEKTPISRRSKTVLIHSSRKSSSYGYKALNAMIYTAHVGDCRAVMLGSAPPRTIKVGGNALLSSSSSIAVTNQDTTDDEESSHHSSDETECLSSSDHDADSSEDEDITSRTGAGAPNSTSTTTSVSTVAATISTAASTTPYMNFPRRVARQRNVHSRAPDESNGPYIALPPLDISEESKITADMELVTDLERRENRKKPTGSGDSSSDGQESDEVIPLVQLPPGTSPIDLTTDHSAYNPAEVTAVLRRCNNAPRAISAGVGGGIKRVAGSLAVTRALGDAYLKTPLLSFLPYKDHAPYISARPEVNCRPLVNDGDKVLILATDGVWERASGEDVLRWVRNFYAERIAEIERRKRRTLNHMDKSQSSNDDDDNDSFVAVPISNNFPQEGSERDLFDRNEVDVATSTNPRKRELLSNLSSSNPPPTIGTALNAASTSSTAKRRKRNHPNGRRNDGTNRDGVNYNVADVIIRRVLNKVRRSRNISSLQALMSLPQGRARRSKHDDITASVVDLSAYVS